MILGYMNLRLSVDFMNLGQSIDSSVLWSIKCTPKSFDLVLPLSPYSTEEQEMRNKIKSRQSWLPGIAPSVHLDEHRMK